MLATLINNADTVKIACMAQLVNVIAPIMTEPNGRAWAQTIYYPFLLTSQYGRGTALRPEVDSPKYTCQVSDSVPYLDCAAVLSQETDILTVILVNKNLNDDIVCNLELDANVESAEQITLTAPSLNSANTADTPCVAESRSNLLAGTNVLSLTLPLASWNMIRVRVTR